MCNARPRVGESRGYVALEALVSFLWGFSLKQKKPLDFMEILATEGDF